MPAEWSPHEATWLGWPHNRTDWPGKIAPIHWVYGEIVRKLAPGERVRILIQNAPLESQVKRLLTRVGVDQSRVDFLRWPTNRGWCRDFGPIFVQKERAGRSPAPETSGGGTSGGEVAVAQFRFNAWAKYNDWKLDTKIAARAAKHFKHRLFHAVHGGKDVVLEGGAIDVNGRGSILTTEECLLDDQTQVRNPGFTRADVESVFRDYLGVTHTLWLNKGIVGDDTHGHVDDICRFVNPTTVVLAQQREADDPNHAILEENRERLEGMRLENGAKIYVVRIPMPAPLYLDGRRLPASYANFYIANAAVLVPTFNDPADREALSILADLFPDRPVVGIHAVDLVWGLGTLHCLTQQEPKG